MSLLPIFRRLPGAGAVGLPTRQIFNQGAVNSCLSCALASAMEAGDPSMPPLSALFHFHEADGETSLDDGLTLAQARRALVTAGICALSDHGFDITPANVGITPSDTALADGRARRPLDRVAGGLRWKTLPTFLPERTWKRCLAAQFAVVIGIQATDRYRQLNATQPVLLNGDGSGPFHAAVVIGYRDADSTFVVQDARGPAFGLEGQWFLPFALCSSPFLVAAFALAPADFP